MVRAEGLEPPHLSTTGPKPAASTNSATRADAVGGAAYNRRGRIGNPIARQLSVPRRVPNALENPSCKNSPNQRASNDPFTLAAEPASTRTTDRTTPRHPDAFARHRRALPALSGNEPVSWTDLTGRLGLSLSEATIASRSMYAPHRAWQPELAERLALRSRKQAFPRGNGRQPILERAEARSARPRVGMISTVSAGASIVAPLKSGRQNRIGTRRS